MGIRGGYLGKFLRVDLNSGDIRTFEVPEEDLERFLGNKGLATKLLWDEMEPGTDALSPDNHLVVTTGPLTAAGAPTSRFNLSAKSPLTGTIMHCNTGGNFGTFLRRTGYDGMVITGKAARPVWIKIDDDAVTLEDAGDLWGLGAYETQSKLPAGSGTMCIGPAGENQVRIACVMSQERALGRGGLGAVMGSKNLKALAATGKGAVPLAAENEFREFIKKWSAMLKEHEVTGKQLPAYGTSATLNICNETNTLPTRNFQTGSFELGDRISGEALAEGYLEKNSGCILCPIRCARVVKYNGVSVKGPEYETIGSFGAGLGIADLEAIIEWNYICDDLGLDTISAGDAIAFACELTANGKLASDLAFGKADGISSLLADIAHRRGLGAELGEGVRRMSEKFGGLDYAIHVKGLELPCYEPRGALAQGLGYATAGRGGCHLAAGYPVYVEANGPITMDPLSIRSKASITVLAQNLLDSISCAGSCLFTAYAAIPIGGMGIPGRALWARLMPYLLANSGFALGPAMRLGRWSMPVPPITRLLPHARAVNLATGRRYTFGEFLEVGERYFTLERLFNLREGLTTADDTLPPRLLHENSTSDPRSHVPLEKLLPRYYWVRGWTPQGVPKPSTLKRLGLPADGIPVELRGGARSSGFHLQAK